jgi:RHS repeat-associated protein
VTATTGTVTGLLGYQSAWSDPGTGKNLMGARWYTPSSGDFASADTMHVSPDPDPAAGNPYAYAADNPLTETDPTGHGIVPAGPTPDYEKDVAAAAEIQAAAAKQKTDAKKDAAAKAEAAKITAEEKQKQKAAAQKKAEEQAEAKQQAEERQAALNRAELQATLGNDAAGIPQKPADASASSPARQQPADAPGCNGRMINTGACPAESGAAGTTPAEVKQSLVGAGQLLLSLVPGGDAFAGADIADEIGGIAEAGDGASSASSASSAGDAGDAGSDDATPEDEGNCPTSAATPGGSSFTAATLVLLATGKAVPISALKPGDKVLAADTATGKDQPETVTAVLVHHDTDLYNLTINTTHGTRVIHTTSNHLFWDPAARKWVKAAALRKGEPLRTPSDTAIAYADGGSVPADHDGWMWDLTVPGNNDHDFYVQDSGTGVLVHNCGEGVSGTVSALKGVFKDAFDPRQLGIGAAGGAAGNYLDAYEDGERGTKLWATTGLGAVTGAVSNVGVGAGLGPSTLIGALAGDINGAGSQLISNGGNIRKLNMGWVAVDTGIGAWGNAVGAGIQGDDENATLGNSISSFMGLWPSAVCGGLDNSQNWNC